jgi:hypothetical protein
MFTGPSREFERRRRGAITEPLVAAMPGNDAIWAVGSIG